MKSRLSKQSLEEQVNREELIEFVNKFPIKGILSTKEVSVLLRKSPSRVTSIIKDPTEGQPIVPILTEATGQYLTYKITSRSSTKKMYRVLHILQWFERQRESSWKQITGEGLLTLALYLSNPQLPKSHSSRKDMPSTTRLYGATKLEMELKKQNLTFITPLAKEILTPFLKELIFSTKPLKMRLDAVRMLLGIQATQEMK